MASSANAAELTPPWLKLPRQITAMILQKLGIVEMLTTAEKVCPTWRRLCQDAAMWQHIDMRGDDPKMLTRDLKRICCEAVDRSQGLLIDINVQGFGSDDVLLYISQRSSKLRCLRLVSCFNVTDEGVSDAIKNFPLLEELHMYYIHTGVATIKSVGRHCPHLKSFKLNRIWCRFPGSGPREPLPIVESMNYDEEALAIAENMPRICHLQILGNKVTNEGVKAILDCCLELESLDLRRCFNVDLGGDLERLCRQRIKDLRLPNDAIDDYEFGARHCIELDGYIDDVDYLYDDPIYSYSDYPDYSDYLDIFDYSDYPNYLGL